MGCRTVEFQPMPLGGELSAAEPAVYQASALGMLVRISGRVGLTRNECDAAARLRVVGVRMSAPAPEEGGAASQKRRGTMALTTTYTGGRLGVTAGRVTAIDVGGSVIGVVSDPEGGNVTISPDGTLALVMPDAAQRGQTSFTVLVKNGEGTREMTVDLKLDAPKIENGWGGGDHYTLETGADDLSVIEPGENSSRGLRHREQGRALDRRHRRTRGRQAERDRRRVAGRTPRVRRERGNGPRYPGRDGALERDHRALHRSLLAPPAVRAGLRLRRHRDVSSTVAPWAIRRSIRSWSGPGAQANGR